MIEFIAPGQGMERPRMGLSVGEGCAEADRLMDVAASEARLPRGWSRNGRELQRTEVAQPALTAVALGAAAALAERGVFPDVITGHSVGEIAALCISVDGDPDAFIRLAAIRGRAMAKLGVLGGMLAVNERPADLPRDVVVAVENPGQIVLSGPTEALRSLGIGTPVATGGRLHHPAMGPAAPTLRGALDALALGPLQVPLVSNRVGALVAGAAAHCDELVGQPTKTVRWTACLNKMEELAVTTAVVLGPTKVIRHHLRLALPGVAVHPVERASDVDRIASTL